MGSKINRIYSAFEDYFSGLLLFLGLSMIFVNIVLRYFFGKPQSLLDEFSVYFVVWGVLSGAAVALRNNHHIKVDMFYNLMPLKVKRAVSLFAYSVGLGFCLLYTFYGNKLVQSYLISGQRSTDSQFPLWIVNLIIPVSGVMLGIRFCEKFYHILKDGGVKWLEEQSGKGELPKNT